MHCDRQGRNGQEDEYSAPGSTLQRPDDRPEERQPCSDEEGARDVVSVLEDRHEGDTAQAEDGQEMGAVEARVDDGGWQDQQGDEQAERETEAEQGEHGSALAAVD